MTTYDNKTGYDQIDQDDEEKKDDIVQSPVHALNNSGVHDQS